VIVVSDTSPITNLAAIGQLDLLRKLYKTIVIPIAVHHEMVTVEKLVPGAVEVQTLDWIKTQAVANVQRVEDIQANQNGIDRGEAEAIVLALEIEAELLLMDERRGRNLAGTFGLNVTGLLGVLLQAKRSSLISSVKPLLDQLIQIADFRVSDELYSFVLKTAGEAGL
jgi:uncharacterized protein